MAKLTSRDTSGTVEDAEVVETPALHGCFEHVMDEKGRVNIPAGFRQALQQGGISQLVLTNGIRDGARCLEGYVDVEWRAFENRLRERSRFDPQLTKLENFYLARASYCAVDGSGRILVPAYLRTYAGLEKEIVFTPSLHGFRMWDRRVWELIFQEAETALLDNPSLFVDVDK